MNKVPPGGSAFHHVADIVVSLNPARGVEPGYMTYHVRKNRSAMTKAANPLQICAPAQFEVMVAASGCWKGMGVDRSTGCSSWRLRPSLW